MANHLCIDDAAAVAELPWEENSTSGARGDVRGTLPAGRGGPAGHVAATGGATRRRIEFQGDGLAATASTRRLDAVFMIT